MTPAQIDLWRPAISEHQRLEFKEAKNGLDRTKLNEYCVAIANEGGGHLILGISDKPPRPVVGTQAFINAADTTDRLFQSIGFRVDLAEIAHPDGRVLVFQIPSRPRGTAYHLDGKYLMRSGGSLVPMSEDRLRAIFAEGGPDWLEEVALREVDDQRVVDLLDTQAFFDLLGQPLPTIRQSVIERLLSERLVDRADGRFSIRRIGALLLAKRIEQFPDLGRKAPRVIVYSGTSKLETRLDRTGSRWYAVGFSGLVQFVMDQLPQNEIIEDALRKEVKLLPQDFIRELIANALVHQDFSVGGASPMIEVYFNRAGDIEPRRPLCRWSD